MKNMLMVLLSSLVIFALCLTCAACTCNKDNDPEDTLLSGGWTRASSPVITSDIQALFDKATLGMVGTRYKPIAYLASQVVAGTNHMFLCSFSSVVPNAVATYVLVTIYEDLQGNASLYDVRESDAEAIGDSNLSGGWTASESPKVTSAAKKALTKATDGLAGASYNPVALLGTQVVAGTNYRILCEVTPVVPNAQTDYMVVQVYADLSGNAEITETWSFARSID